MWELDHKEGWVLKNWCFWTVVLEKTLEGPLDCKEIQPVNHKRNQPWVFIGRTGAEAEAPILWPFNMKSRLTGKVRDPGKGWRQEEKGATEDEMVGWHHRLNGCEFEQAPGDGEGQGSLACCRPWGCKESDVTKQLNKNSKLICSRVFHYLFSKPKLSARGRCYLLLQKLFPTQTSVRHPASFNRSMDIRPPKAGFYFCWCFDLINTVWFN